jgi:multidrug efflux pump subunit AcrA (membrane-fusion protein)
LKPICALSLLGVLAITPSFAGADASTPTTTAHATARASTQPTTSASAEPATAPATVAVKRGTLAMKFDAGGYFEPIDSVDVKIKPKAYAGEMTILSIVNNGATVKKGDKLLEIDPAPLKKQLDAAENEAAVAKATLIKAEADAKIAKESEALSLRVYKDAVRDAEDALKWWEGVEGPEMIEQAELGLKQYREMVEDRVDELDQLKKMYKSEELTNATADIVVKRAVRGVEHAKKGLEWEEQRTEKTETYSFPITDRQVHDSLTQARQGLASVQAAQAQSKVVRQAGLATAKAAQATAEQKLSDLQADLEKLTVMATADGVVWYGGFAQGNWQGGDPKTLKVGEKIAAQQSVMTLYQPGKLRVVADLPEAKYYLVTPGTKATAKPSAFPGLRCEGTCQAGPRTPVMNPQQGPMYPMTVQIGDADPRIMPGMRAAVQVQVPPLENVLLAPVAAVVDSNVWVMEKPGAEQKRAVVTGHSDGKNVEIVSGLSEGDKILAQGKQ